MRRKVAVLAFGMAMIGASCSGSDSQSVNADGSPDAALSAEVVDGEVGAEFGVGDENNENNEALSAEQLEANQRSTDGATNTAGGTDTTGSTSGDTPGTAETTTPPSTVPVLGVPAAPEGGGVIVDSGDVEIDAASTTEIECFVEDFSERSDVDLLNGIDGGVDLANSQLTDAIALQAGFHPGPTLLAADRCLSPKARYEVAANTPLLQGVSQEQLDCMWPALQVIGAELSSGVSLEELLTQPSQAMIEPLNQMVACIS